MKSPAEIVRGILILKGLCFMPQIQGQTLPPVVQPRDGMTACFVNVMPDDPDQIVVVSDISGAVFGRTSDGKQSIHPGIGIMVRALDARGYDLAESIVAALETVKRQTVRLDDIDYVVQSVYLNGTIVSLGQEPGKRRRLWKTNYRMAFA